jgi:hypothetical protein
MPRWEPPQEQIVEKPKPRRWPAVVLLLAIIAVAGYGLWMLWRRLHPRPYATAAVATDVRSDISGTGDSLDVAVSWGLADVGAGLPDSLRVEVGRGGGESSQSHVIPGSRRSDTLRIAAPAEGETVSGYSCVAAVRGGRLAPERCTPWQYVRPAASLSTTPVVPDTTSHRPKRAPAPPAAAHPAVASIVIQPAGQQVDPDIGGKCAAWQRGHPGRSVWIEVNRKAVPACMGPNGKPTVVQFCAFALLADGRRVQTENSSGVPYCAALFETWVRERVT